MKLARMASAGTLLVAIVWGFPAAAASDGPTAEGHGSGIYLHPPFTGDRVAIDLDASGSEGHFDVVHYDKFGKVFAHLTGSLDCVRVTGNQAFTTGTITAGFASEFAGNVDGKAFAVTILDNGDADAAGVSYPLEQIPACSPWPLNTVMDRGAYSIDG